MLGKKWPPTIGAIESRAMDLQQTFTGVAAPESDGGAVTGTERIVAPRQGASSSREEYAGSVPGPEPFQPSQTDASSPAGELKFLQSILAGSPDVITVVSSDGVIVYASDAITQVFGISPDVVRGR